jgi:S1-C subfamily serine protease
MNDSVGRQGAGHEHGSGAGQQVPGQQGFGQQGTGMPSQWQAPGQSPDHWHPPAPHQAGPQEPGAQEVSPQQPGPHQAGQQPAGSHQGGHQQGGPQPAGPHEQRRQQAAGQQQGGSQLAGQYQAGWQQAGPGHVGQQYAGQQQGGPQVARPQQGGWQPAAPEQVGQQYAGQQQFPGQQFAGQAPYGGYPQYPGYPPYGGQQQRPRKRGRRLLGAGALGLAAVMVAGSVAWGIDQSQHASGSQLAQQQLDPTAVAAKVSPGLVDVNTVLGYQGARAAGTGIVLTSDGEVLTNHHVIEGATSISVTDIGNGKTYTASVVGYDDQHDIAVLKLKDASGLQTAKTGNSDKVALGDQVVGIGNAGGVGGTPSYAAGKVTGLNQAITATDESGQDPENLTGLIQTDANIQAGDSGGPLANASGEVVGVDVAGSGGNNGGSGRPGQTSATTGSASTAILAASGDNGPGFGPGSGFGDGSGGFGDGSGNGYGDGSGDGSGNGSGNGQGQTTTQGYAIPINQALDIVDQIEAGKASDTVHIGESAMLGISVMSNADVTGAVVGDVIADGKADEAGIESGDVITSFAGHTVESPDSLSALLNKQHAGDKVEVGWVDQEGQTHKATIELIAGPVR